MAKSRARQIAPELSQTSNREPVLASVTSICDWGQQLVESLAGKIPSQELLLLKGQLETVTQAATASVENVPSATTPKIVRGSDSLVTLASTVATAPELVVHIETAGLDPRKGEIVGIGVAVEDATYYIPTAHRIQDSGELRPHLLAHLLYRFRAGVARAVGQSPRIATRGARKVSVG